MTFAFEDTDVDPFEDAMAESEFEENWEQNWIRRQQQEDFARQWQAKAAAAWRKSQHHVKPIKAEDPYTMIGTRNYEQKIKQLGDADIWQKKAMKKWQAAKAKKAAKKKKKAEKVAAAAEQAHVEALEVSRPHKKISWEQKWKNRQENEKFLHEWESKARKEWHAPKNRKHSQERSPYEMIGTKNWKQEIPRVEAQTAFAKRWQEKSQKKWVKSQARRHAIKAAKAAKKATLTETGPEEKLSWRQRWAQREFSEDWQAKAQKRFKEYQEMRKFDRLADQN